MPPRFFRPRCGRHKERSAAERRERCRARAEPALIDATRPMHQMLEAAFAEFSGDGICRHHDPDAGIVEASQPGVGPRPGNAPAGSDIFRKTRVIARGKKAPYAPAIVAHGVTDRAFRRDMNVIRRQMLDPPTSLTRRNESQRDLRIGRQGNRRESLRRQEMNVDIQSFGGRGHRFERPNDAVDLRVPSVGGDENAHQAACSAGSRSTGSTYLPVRARSRARFCQHRISRRPSSCSTTAVQDSTKSPVLT